MSYHCSTDNSYDDNTTKQKDKTKKAEKERRAKQMETFLLSGSKKQTG
jgi:hypothetical protein